MGQYQTMQASPSAEKLQHLPVPPQVAQVTCSQPTWVIEEVIDFKQPEAEAVLEAENINPANGCVPLIRSVGRDGFLNSCLHLTCADDDEVVAKEDDNFN